MRKSSRINRISSKNTVEISSQTLWTIIGINALISLVISLLAVLVVGPWLYGAPPANTGKSVAADTPAAGSATATPAKTQPTPTPTPRAEPLEYVVQTGDTLGTIAEQFGITTDDLMAMNSLTDPNLIRVGQTLYIPAAGQPLPTPTPTATIIPAASVPQATTEFVLPPADISFTPTPSPTPIPTATAPPLGQISVNITNVLGYGKLDEEQVLIANTGPGVQLVGWTLSGSAAGTYTFPNMFLFNGGQVAIHTATGSDSYTDLYWGLNQPAWQSGNTLTLKNIKGEIIATYIIP